MPQDRVLSARIWIAQVGRIPLLLLDSDIAENDRELRYVTDRLYGGDQDHRIKQEILAGIGACVPSAHMSRRVLLGRMRRHPRCFTPTKGMRDSWGWSASGNTSDSRGWMSKRP